MATMTMTVNYSARFAGDGRVEEIGVYSSPTDATNAGLAYYQRNALYLASMSLEVRPTCFALSDY